MLISYTRFCIFLFKFILINFLKNVFETSVVFFKNGIFRRQIQRPFFAKCHIHTTACKAINTFIGIVHAHCNTVSLKIKHFKNLCFSTIFWCKGHRQFSFPFNHRISCTVLITKCMTTNDNWGSPVGYQTWYILHYNWLTKNSTIQDITNSPVWRLPHLL